MNIAAIKRALFVAVDLLVLLSVCKNATWSIVLHRYGEASEWLSITGWYLLALGYLLLAAAATSRPCGREPPTRFARPPFAVGAVLGLLGSVVGISANAVAPLIQRADWLALVLAFSWCALVVRPVPTAGATTVNS